MKKLILPILFTVFLVAFSSPVFAEGQGTIRIEPHSSYYGQPTMLSSPATFNISITEGGDTSYDPHILLAMTNDSYYGLTGDVTVTWTGGSISFSSTDFTGVDDTTVPNYVPPLGTTNGVRYVIATLQSHLNVSNSETVWWTWGPFLSNPITQTKQEFTVTLPSTSPRMLVYALGKTQNSDLFDNMFNNRVPPTQPGFVVPELGPALLAASSFSAFVLYTIKRKKNATFNSSQKLPQ